MCSTIESYEEMSNWTYRHWQNLLREGMANNGIVKCGALKETSILAPLDNFQPYDLFPVQIPVGATNVHDQMLGEPGICKQHLVEPRDLDRLTKDNLQRYAYDPYYPIITASECTHSLHTPSIGTMSSDEDICIAESCGYTVKKRLKDTSSTTPGGGLAKQNSVAPDGCTADRSKTEKETSALPAMETYKLFASDIFTSNVQILLKAIRQGI